MGFKIESPWIKNKLLLCIFINLMYKNINYIYKSELGPKTIDYKVIYKIFTNLKNGPKEIYKTKACLQYTKNGWRQYTKK